MRVLREELLAQSALHPESTAWQPWTTFTFWNMLCTHTPPCFHVSWVPWDTQLRSACVQKAPGVREAGPVEGGWPEMQSHPRPRPVPWDTLELG